MPEEPPAMRAGPAVSPSALISTTVVPIAAAIAIALAVMVAVGAVFRLAGRVARRSRLAADLITRAHLPTQSFLAVTAARVIIDNATAAPWLPTIQHLLLLLQIGTGAWLVAALVLTVEDAALDRFRMDVADNLHARRLHTQITLIRRMSLALIGVVAVGAMLFTFPAARAAGAGLLASAGIAGIVAALAAQSVLGNLVAGLQLAFGDALRLDDVVVVEGEWGRIEEMTLSYVVVKIWDERRLILPASYFTKTPFQNWTRTSASVLGTIYLHVDWSIPLDEMRAELERVCHASDLWDRRVCSLIVTDATGGMVEVRALISAADSGRQWDLRCLVRESLVTWVRTNHPDSLPRMRTDLTIPGQGQQAAAGPDMPLPAPAAAAD